MSIDVADRPMPLSRLVLPEAAPQPGWSRGHRLLEQWGAEVTVLSLVGLALPLGLATRYGTLGVPTSDDWAYALAAFHFARTGHIFLFHWITINFVGQAVLALPVVAIFGPHLAALDIFTCCLGWCGLIAVCHLGRSLGLPRPTALAVSTFVGLTPVWLQYSVSFMTDIPAISFTVMSLAVLASDRRTDRYVTPSAVGALLLGFVAFTFRETTCPVLAAIVVSRAWRGGRPSLRSVRGWLALSSAFAVVAVTEYAWRHTLAGEGYQPPPGLHPLVLASSLANSWVWPMTGLLLLPVALYLGGPGAIRRSYSSRPGRLLGVITLWPVLPFIAHIILVTREWFSGFTPPIGAFLANLVLSFGNQGFDLSPIAAATSGQRWALIGLSGVLSILALASWVMLAALVTGRRPQKRLGPRLSANEVSGQAERRLVLLAATGAAALFLALFSASFPLFERDAMVFLVPTGVALASLTPSRRGLLCPTTGLVASIAISVVSVVASARMLAIEGGTWHYAKTFGASHAWVPPSDISAGWVWDSYQAHTIRMAPVTDCYRLEVGAPATDGHAPTRISIPFSSEEVAIVRAAPHLPRVCRHPLPTSKNLP